MRDRGGAIAEQCGTCQPRRVPLLFGCSPIANWGPCDRATPLLAAPFIPLRNCKAYMPYERQSKTQSYITQTYWKMTGISPLKCFSNPGGGKVQQTNA